MTFLTLSLRRAVTAMMYCKGALDERESESGVGVHVFDLRTWKENTDFYGAQGCLFSL